MKHLVTGLIVALGISLTTGVSVAHAAKGVRKNAPHIHRGRLVGMEKHPSGGTTITVQMHTHHKKTHHSAGGAAKPTHATVTRKFHVDKNTKVMVSQSGQHHAGSHANMQKGTHVVVWAKDHHADQVLVGSTHHHQPKTKARVKTRGRI